MTQDKGASADADRATAVEPVPVSPLRDGIPSADGKHEVREVPTSMIPLLFPRNWFCVEVAGDGAKISAYTDAAGIDELIARLGIVKSLLARGLMPQAVGAADAP